MYILSARWKNITALEEEQTSLIESIEKALELANTNVPKKLALNIKENIPLALASIRALKRAKGDVRKEREVFEKELMALKMK